MIINISHNNKVLISKDVITIDKDMNQFTWSIKTFKEHFNLDISKYSLQQLKMKKESITIELNTKDLKNWRNLRLNDLGI